MYLIHTGLRNLLCDIIWTISLSNRSCWLERKGHVRQSMLHRCIWQLSPFQILCNFGSSVLGKVPEFCSRHAFWSFCYNRCVFWNESHFLIWMFWGALWLILLFYFIFVHSMKAAFWGAFGPDRQEHHLFAWSHKLYILMKEKTPQTSNVGCCRFLGLASRGASVKSSLARA